MDDQSSGSAAPPESLACALPAWRNSLGEAHVLTEPHQLAPYLHSTSDCGTVPLAVLRPGTTPEVQEVARIAAAHGLPLYPISRGRNWGYGDACAVHDGQVIVDLSRMDRILHVDETLAYAVIEPGVTQGQLSSYLRDHGIPLIMDCTGAGPDTSLVGNIMERGYGHSAYGNRMQTISGLEIVLPNGELLKTGFGHYDNAQATHLFPYGVGPYLDGLFTQSGLGITTRMGLWLMPEPEHTVHFICMIDADDDLAAAVDTLRKLRLDGTLRSIVHVGNDLRLLSSGGPFPRDRTGGAGRLPADLRRQMRREAGLGAWTISGALTGSRPQVNAARQALRRALRRPGWRLRFLTEGKLDMGYKVARAFRGTGWGQRLQATVETARALFDMNKGIPSRRFLAGAYWKRRGGLPEHFPQQANPAADNCGMYWVSPVIPMRGEDAVKLHDTIEPIMTEYDFDLLLTLNTVTDRALGGVITVSYDKEDPGEVRRARACHDALLEAVMRAGYPPYRVGPQAMPSLNPRDDSYWATVRRIKQALDPKGIMAPGRY